MARRAAGLIVVAGAAVLAACSSSSTSGRLSGSPAPTSSSGSSSAPTSRPPTSSSTSAAPTSSAPTTAPPSRLTDVRIADVTYVGDHAWLLGTATCLNDSSRRCSAIERSTDGGRTWHSAPAPAGVGVSVPDDKASAVCNAPCVTGIRFASAQVGYLFGRSSLYLTTDGGGTWHSLSGGADALEAADGTVLRVIDHGGCPPGCDYMVQTARVGSADWQTVPLPGRGNESTGVTLARAGSRVYLATYANQAGGGSDAKTVLWSSTDDGRTWRNRGEPCHQRNGHEFDSTQLTVSPDGSAVLLCQPRARPDAAKSVTVSVGDNFAESLRSLGGADVSAIGAASQTIVFASSDDTYRSVNGGDTFRAVRTGADDAPGQLGWIGFSSGADGHAMSLDRTTLWNTTDGGQSWRAVTPH